MACTPRQPSHPVQETHGVPPPTIYTSRNFMNKQKQIHYLNTSTARVGGDGSPPLTAQEGVCCGRGGGDNHLQGRVRAQQPRRGRPQAPCPAAATSTGQQRRGDDGVNSGPGSLARNESPITRGVQAPLTVMKRTLSNPQASEGLEAGPSALLAQARTSLPPTPREASNGHARHFTDTTWFDFILVTPDPVGIPTPLTGEKSKSPRLRHVPRVPQQAVTEPHSNLDVCFQRPCPWMRPEAGDKGPFLQIP